MMQRSRRDTGGFTLIELMLAMAFIAMMLIAIAMLVIHIGATYNRGITLRQVNQAGRTVVTDMQRTIASGPAFAISEAALAEGRLCTGQYSYIWNTADKLAGPAADRNVYSGSDSSRIIRLVRVPDSNGQYCHPDSLSPRMAIDRQHAVELLDLGDRPLALHGEFVAMSDETLVYNPLFGQRLYTIAFTLGTDDISAIDVTDDRCRPPGDSASDLTYCAINEFTFTIRAGIR